jgi:hypothetical protein
VKIGVINKNTGSCVVIIVVVSVVLILVATKIVCFLRAYQRLQDWSW